MDLDNYLKQIKTTSPLHITISGNIGSGKSTFAKHLAKELNIERIYIGQLIREEAAKRKMTLDDFLYLLESDDSIDKEMDELQNKKSKEITQGIFEGRISWHFVTEPKIKIFFQVNPKTSAERIWGDDNKLRDKYATIDKLIEANTRREQSEKTRFSEYYNVNVYDLSNFDIIIDTSNLSITETFEKTTQEIAKFLTNNN